MTHADSSRAFADSLDPWVIALLAVAILMLAATVFYPFGYDQAVFATAGEMILHGAVPYREFLDTKPPLIYEIYALALWLFGEHDSSVRLFDIIWQVVTALYFFKLLRRYLPKNESLIAVSLMLIAYSGSGFWMTEQAESFSVLPSLALLDATLRVVESRGQTIVWSLVAGAATMVLFALKFTFAIGGAASLCFLLVSRIAIRRKVQFLTGFIASSITLLTCAALWLQASGAWHSFLQSITWLSKYASLAPSQHSWLVEMLIIFPERIVYSMSVSIALLVLIGLLPATRKGLTDAGSNHLRALLLITFLFQLAGIAAERKIEFPYQYTRAIWAITPIAAGVLYYGVNKYWTCSTVRRCAVSVAIVILILVLSPVARIGTQTIPWSWIGLSGTNAAAEVQRRVPDYYAEEQREVASYLNARMTVQDNFFLWGNDVGIYFFAHRLPRTICLTATPLRTAFTPAKWKSSLLQQLAETQPMYWVVEFGDARPYITGSSLDSYQALLRWPELAQFLRADYAQDTTIGHFALFRRRPR